MAPATEVAEPDRPPRRPGGLRDRRRSLAAAAVLAVAALAAAGVLLLGGDGDDDAGPRTFRGPGGAFALTHPSTWRPLPAEELQALPDPPAAMLRRRDGKGVVVVRREGRARPTERFARQLERELRRRVPDLRPTGTRTIVTRAGEALFYSYVRERAGTVHGIVVVPRGQTSWVLTTVSPGDAPESAREIGRMILSFDV